MSLGLAPGFVAVRKAAEDEILAAADRMQPAIRRVFLDAVAELQQSTPVNQIADLLEAGQVDAALALLPNLTPEQLAPIRDTLYTATATTARFTTAALNVEFALVNPRAVRFAEEQTGQLLQHITDSPSRAIRDVIVRGQTDAVNVRSQAQQIRRIIGLSDRDARATNRFFFGSLQEGIREARVHELADRMGNRLLRARAENIARTETIKASNAGVRLGFETAKDQGLLPDSARMVWIVTVDSRLCQLCAPMEGKTVLVGDPFQADRKATSFTVGTGDVVSVADTDPMIPITVQQPPLHNRCRCAIGIA
jgi:hypothetical protein